MERKGFTASNYAPPHTGSGYSMEDEFADIPLLTTVCRREERFVSAYDGTKLKTIIYYPEGIPAPWPTIVQRTCYPTSNILYEQTARNFALRGFAYVFQYCRGTGKSEGVWEPYVNERDDGLALANWLQEQPWVESMGLYGASYLALTAWCIADQAPEKLKTMFVSVFGSNRHASAWKDGLFRQDILTGWTMGNAGRPVTASYISSALYRPQMEVDEALWDGKIPWYRDLISHPDIRDTYWQDGFWGLMLKCIGKIRIPMFVGEGWYDHHLGSALGCWEMLSDEAKAHSVMQINPGNHGLAPFIFGHTDAKNAAIKWERKAYEWFDQILRRKQLPEPGIKAYVVGADEWKTFPSYPFPECGETRLYLTEKGLVDAPEADGKREYIYDPKDPIFTHGGESLLVSMPLHGGSREQPEPDWREDLISFVSQPLQKDMEVCGKIRVQLYVQTTAADTSFAVKLMEVFEDGRAFHIRNGITTLSWADGVKKPYDGGIKLLDIDVWDIAWQLKKGSRLRLDVSSSNFPEYSIHPNTTQLWSEAVDTVTAKQTVYFGKTHPSCIILPSE